MEEPSKLEQFLLAACMPINKRWLHEAIKNTSMINTYDYSTNVGRWFLDHSTRGRHYTTRQPKMYPGLYKGQFLYNMLWNTLRNRPERIPKDYVYEYIRIKLTNLNDEIIMHTPHTDFSASEDEEEERIPSFAETLFIGVPLNEAYLYQAIQKKWRLGFKRPRHKHSALRDSIQRWYIDHSSGIPPFRRFQDGETENTEFIKTCLKHYPALFVEYLKVCPQIAQDDEGREQIQVMLGETAESAADAAVLSASRTAGEVEMCFAWVCQYGRWTHVCHPGIPCTCAKPFSPEDSKGRFAPSEKGREVTPFQRTEGVLRRAPTGQLKYGTAKRPASLLCMEDP